MPWSTGTCLFLLTKNKSNFTYFHLTNFLARGKIHIYLSNERGREPGYGIDVLSNSGTGPSGRNDGHTGEWPGWRLARGVWGL